MTPPNNILPPPRIRRYSADWWWDIAIKTMIPVAAALSGIIAAHEAALHDHGSRIGVLEKQSEKTTEVYERILERLTEIQVSIGRLEERIAARNK